MRKYGLYPLIAAVLVGSCAWAASSDKPLNSDPIGENPDAPIADHKQGIKRLVASLAGNGLGIDGGLRLDDEISTMIVEMIQNPTFGPSGMTGVPSRAIGVLRFTLADSGSTQAAQLRQLARVEGGVDLTSELMDSIEQIDVFTLPNENMPAGLGALIRCHEMAEMTSFVKSIQPLLDEANWMVKVIGNHVVVAQEEGVLEAVTDEINALATGE